MAGMTLHTPHPDSYYHLMDLAWQQGPLHGSSSSSSSSSIYNQNIGVCLTDVEGDQEKAQDLKRAQIGAQQQSQLKLVATWRSVPLQPASQPPDFRQQEY
eukprot:1139498-Pelagomonas_calceolata.AAC.1